MSTAAVWKISIEHAKGDLPFNACSAFHMAGFAELPITGDYMQAVAARRIQAGRGDSFMAIAHCTKACRWSLRNQKIWRYHAALTMQA